MYHRKGTNDTLVINSVMESDEYHAKDITSYKNGDVFIDLGAHIGTWSILMAIKNPTFKIYAYEAIPDNYELMKKNIELNKLTNVFSFLEAVSDVSGEKINIYHTPSDTPFNAEHRFIGSMMSTQGEHYETTTISLRDAFERAGNKIKVIKTDCEGCELKGFPSLTTEQIKNIDYVIGEYHPYNMDMEDFYGLFKPYFNRLWEPHKNELQGFVFKNKEVQ